MWLNYGTLIINFAMTLSPTIQEDSNLSDFFRILRKSDKLKCTIRVLGTYFDDLVEGLIDLESTNHNFGSNSSSLNN